MKILHCHKEEKRVIEGSETQNAIKLGCIKPGEVSRPHHHGHAVTVNSLLPTIDEVIDKLFVQ